MPAPPRSRPPGRRLSGCEHVRVEQLQVPQEWPPGDFDLVVVSETAYFLSPRELRGLVDRVRASLTPRGVVVLCHWRHRIDGWALDADEVRRAFTEDEWLPVQATYRDRDVEILLLAATDALPEPTA